MSRIAKYFCVCNKKAVSKKRISMEKANNINENPIEKPPKKLKKLKIISKYNFDDINYSDFRPCIEIQKEFPYNCPICFRFFDKILKTTCCKNYMCLDCADEINQRYKQTPNPEIRCTYCVNTYFKLVDVEEHEEIKVYTDSPFGAKLLQSNKKQSEGENRGSHSKSQKYASILIEKNLDPLLGSLERSKEELASGSHKSLILRGIEDEDDKENNSYLGQGYKSECSLLLESIPSDSISIGLDKINFLYGIREKDFSLSSKGLTASRNYLCGSDQPLFSEALPSFASTFKKLR